MKLQTLARRLEGGKLNCQVSKQQHYLIAKADRRPREKKKFYHQFSIVKYLYLPTDTFRKYVEMQEQIDFEVYRLLQAD